MPGYDPNALQACIDLGSNSFHLLIGRWVDGRIQIIERCSDRVQLAAGMCGRGEISHSSFERGLRCLERFDALLNQYPIERYWALGTNTFRVATNAAQFIEAASDIGMHISVITGVQEAILIYAGVLTALPQNEARRLVIDIGGGSTEVVAGQGAIRHITESLAVGSVAWRDRFFSSITSDEQTLIHCMDEALLAARNVFSRIAPAVKAAGWTEAYASSGTVKMLTNICEAQGYGKGEVSQRALIELRPRFMRQVLEGVELEGLKERRRDLLMAGWSVLLGLMQAYDIEKIKFSTTALREGMLDFMMRNDRALDIMASAGMPTLRERE